MLRFFSGPMSDLHATGRARRNNRFRLARSRQDSQLPYLHGEVIMRRVIAKRSGHATTAGVDHINIKTEAAHPFDCGGSAARESILRNPFSSLMTMWVKGDLAVFQ